MKRLLVFLICLFLFCDEGGNKKGDDEGTSPAIWDVYCYHGGLQSYVYNIGDIVEVELWMFDPDKDALTAHIETYSGSVKINAYTKNLSPQIYKDIIYTFYMTVDVPAGYYTVFISVEDEEGNFSDIYTLNYLVI